MTPEEQLAEIVGIPLEIRNIRIYDFDINYVVAGDGPPLLLLHGGNIGWGQWYPNIKAFSNYYKVYALDIPGAGRSSRVSYQHFNLQRDIVDVVQGFVEKLSLAPLSIIGSSIGGWTALQIAFQKPTLVNKLILADSIGFMDYMRMSDRLIGVPIFAQTLARTVLKPVRKNKNIERFLRDVFYDKKFPFPQAFIEYFYETMATSHNLLFISRLSSFWGMRKELILKNILPEIKQQVLIIWGEKDALMPLDKNSAHFKLLPHVKVVTLPNTGHIPSIEASDMFNKQALEFLNS